MGKHQKSIIMQAIERLDSKMAIGESRYEAKKIAREASQATGQHVWSFSTGRIHSHKTRMVYQEHALRFVSWARKTEGIKHLEQLDPRANELASRYLRLGLGAHKKPSTLKTERAALRMFFDDRALASEVALPERKREQIVRSRLPAKRDSHFQPANWPTFLAFERAAGLRRNEVKLLCVGDVHQDHHGQLVVYVRNGKGGKTREVPVLAGCEDAVLSVVTRRKPEEKVFARVPDTDIHALRREYAQALYRQYAPERGPLPTHRRLRPTDYDKDAALGVSRALGHNRLDVVLRNYLR